jgi:sigma-B regulation protein RsbU (phosphoserine phosphatase)
MAEHRIRCAEIWGGVDSIDLDVATSALTASVYSKSCEGSSGGDIYYFSVCGSDQLTRIAVADVQGHGEAVSTISRWLYELVRDSMDSLDATGVLTKLNALALERGFGAASTAALLSYYRGDRQLYISYAGHPPALAQHKQNGEWVPLMLDEGAGLCNLPLGLMPNVTYSQKILPLEIGDRLFLYTDGITEYPNAAGEPLGSPWLVAQLRESGQQTLAEIKRSVLARLKAENAGGMNHDDITLMAVEIAPPPTDAA